MCFMFNALAIMISHTTNYIFENLSCLSYGFEVILHKYLINFSCYDLLVDISESFGIWVVIFVLVCASLNTSTAVHQHSKPSKEQAASSEKNQSSVYASFLKFVTLQKTKL